MADNKHSIKIEIGAALAGSFSSTVAKASKEMAELGEAMRDLDNRSEKMARLGELRVDLRDKGERRIEVGGKVAELRKEAEVIALSIAEKKAQAKKLAALERKGYESVTSESSKSIGKEVRAMEAGLKSKQNEAAPFIRQLKSIAKEERTLGRELARTEAELRKNGIATEDLTKATAELDAERKKLGQERHFQGIRDRIGEAVGNLKNMAAWMIRIRDVATDIGSKLLGIARDTAAQAMSLRNAAASIGSSTQALQGLKFAGQQAGVEDMDKMLGKMNVRLQQAALGQGEAGQALRRLRLDARQLMASGPEGAFLKITAALERIPSAAERSFILTKLFEEEGVKLGALMDKGVSGIRKYQAQLASTGAVMGYDLVQDSMAFTAAQNLLGASLEGVRNRVAAGMLPAFTEAFTAIAQLLIDNKDTFISLGQAVGGVISGITPPLILLGKVFFGIASALAPVFGWIHKILDATGAYYVLVPLVVGAMGYMAIQIAEITALKWGEARAQLALNAAERARNAGGAANAMGFFGKSGMSLGTRGFVGAMNTMKSLLNGGYKLMGGLATGMSWLMGGLQMATTAVGTIASAIASVGSAIVGGLASAFSAVVGVFAGIGSAIAGAFASAGAVVMGVLGTIGSAIMAVVTSPIALITAAFATGFGIGTLLTKLKPVRDFCYAIGDGFTWIWEKAVGLWDWLAGKFDSMFGWIGRIFSSTGATASIGAAAVAMPTAAVAGNLPSPELDRAPLRAPAVASQSRSVTVNSPVNVTVNGGDGQDKRALAREVADEISRRQRADRAGSLNDNPRR